MNAQGEHQTGTETGTNTKQQTTAADQRPAIAMDPARPQLPPLNAADGPVGRANCWRAPPPAWRDGRGLWARVNAPPHYTRVVPRRG